ncbi:MAG: hypothetical protein LBV61_10995 [Burkholderiaceae bacterium]|nr:hypothetical protein [Burkholderiaceae bacterium]
MDFVPWITVLQGAVGVEAGASVRLRSMGAVKAVECACAVAADKALANKTDGPSFLLFYVDMGRTVHSFRKPEKIICCFAGFATKTMAAH